MKNKGFLVVRQRTNTHVICPRPLIIAVSKIKCLISLLKPPLPAGHPGRSLSLLQGGRLGRAVQPEPNCN